MTDDDTERMSALFNRAMDTGPTTAALDRLIYCTLLERLTHGDLKIALEEFSNPGTLEAAIAEFQALDKEQLNELAAGVMPMWSVALSHAVKLMFRASRRLGYDPDDLSPEYVALFGSLFLSDLAGVVDDS